VLGCGLHVGAAGSLLLVAVAFALAVDARAQADDFAEEAGSHLLRGARGQTGTAQVLHVNGLPFRMKTGLVRQSVSAVLDGFDERCGVPGAAAWTGGLPADAVQRLASMGGIGTGRLRPVLRAESDAGGYVACLDLRTPPETSEIVQRLRAFAATFDLAAIGDLRFAWALQEGDGTAFVAVRSEGPVRLAQLFPVRGDAPGVDLPGIPRPPGARRVLSAWHAEQPAMLASYRVELAAAELAARYGRRLIDGGFAVRRGGRSAGAPRWLLAERAGAFTAVAIDGAGDAHSTVTLLPLR
jgi:hypothetical protein